MSNLNNVSLMGRLTKDVELRHTQSGKSVASFTLAVDNPGKDAGASFINCVAWSGTAEFISKYFPKGSMIAVEGRLMTRQYDDKGGNKRTVTEVVVAQAYFCGGKTAKNDGKPDFVEIEDDEDFPF